MKTIQLTDEIYTAFIDLLERLEQKQQPISDWLLIKTLINLIKPQGEKDRSVIEWHSMDEKPNKFNWVITKDINGFISSDYVVYIGNDDWHLERTEKSCLAAWAYLPD